MSVVRDVEGFLADHDLCGGMEIDACPPVSAFAYSVSLTCCCGGVFDRLVTPEDAMVDLVWTAQLYARN
jgi:hypothetical protein